MQIPIKRGETPKKPARRKESRFPFEKMEIMDFIDVPPPHVKTAYTRAWLMRSRNPLWSYHTERQPNGWVRFWRM